MKKTIATTILAIIILAGPVYPTTFPEAINLYQNSNWTMVEWAIWAKTYSPSTEIDSDTCKLHNRHIDPSFPMWDFVDGHWEQVLKAHTTPSDGDLRTITSHSVFRWSDEKDGWVLESQDLHEHSFITVAAPKFVAAIKAKPVETPKTLAEVYAGIDPNEVELRNIVKSLIEKETK